MHVYITGGSGENGRLIIKEALSHGHTVTALVRNPDSLEAQAGLTLVKGTPTSEQDIRRALSTPELPSAVFIALSMRRTSGSPFAPLSPDSPLDLLSSTTKILLSTLSGLQIRPKIIVNSTQGVPEAFSSLAFPIRAMFTHASGMRIANEEHQRLDSLVRNSGLPFVFARPGALLSGELKPVKEFPDCGKGAPWLASITRSSLAQWMVESAETEKWDGRAPVLSN